MAGALFYCHYNKLNLISQRECLFDSSQGVILVLYLSAGVVAQRPLYLPALRATGDRPPEDRLPKEAFIGSASCIFYAGGAGERACERLQKWVGLIRVGLLFMPRAARAPSSDPFGATFFPKKAYNRNRARRAHLLKPSAVSCQPSAGDAAERASPVFQSDSLSSRAQMSHYASCAFALCTLHFALFRTL